jgi:pimeloyl-ACP methyl ester carboxylesterase
MDITKRKEVEINNNIFSYIFLEGQNKEKNIFFFHATGFNAETYIPFFLKLNELLENQYSIYALDQRGHGLSEATAVPSELSSWNTYFEDGKNFLSKFSSCENILMGHSMGGVVAARLAYDFEDKVSKSILIDPVLQLQSLKFQIPFFNISNKTFSSLLSFFKKNRASEMISNAKKRRSIFADKEEIFNHYQGRGAFTNWPEESLKAYINGGVRKGNNQINLSCDPEWEAKTFAVSYAARTNFIKKLNKKTYVPYASSGSTLSPEVRDLLSSNPNYFFEKIDGSHFFPMEEKDLICTKISNFINAL